MILTAKDFEYDFQKRNECIQECSESVKNGTMDPQTMEELCEIERFAPFPWNVGGNCFLCGEKLTLPALAWSGFDKNDGNKPSHIAVHPDCAPRLFLGMRNDWHKYDQSLRPGGATYDASKPYPFNGIHKQ